MKKLLMILFVSIVPVISFGYSNSLESADWKMRWICFDQNGTETLRVDSDWIDLDGSSGEWVQVVMKTSHSMETFSFLAELNIPDQLVISKGNELIIQFKRRSGDSNGCNVFSSGADESTFTMYGSFGCKGTQKNNTVTIEKANGKHFQYHFGNHGGSCSGYGF